MPKTWTPNGNYAQTLAYREVAGPLHERMNAKALSKRIAVAKMAADPKPFSCIVSNRRAERAEYRAELRKQRRSARSIKAKV